MSVLADILATVHLNLATGEFEASAAKAADSAGATMSNRLRSKLTGAVSGAIGAGAGLAFGVAAKGAAELDAATQQLVADTGLTGDAAVEARDQIASMYRDNLQGFDQISAALSKVHTDLGLTGDEAGTVAAAFLKFSTATGQDAAQAVGGVDDALDSFNLKATDAPGLLDKLVVSHQKWGGSIAENETALSKIGPQLTAFGLSIDDGIGLLNMFQAAGIDSSKVPAALNAALKKVKSPAEFKKLLKDIADTKDPFEQAQKAIDLFGARAGPQLAQALRQGNLDDFAVSMEEAKGATDQAAQAVESGWGNQFQLILKNAGGALAEFGSNFGPLLLVAGQFGPKMLAGISGAFGGLGSFIGPKIAAAFGSKAVTNAVADGLGDAVSGAAGSSKLGGATSGLGKFLGSKLGTGLSVAFAAVAVVEVVNTYNDVRDQLNAQSNEIGKNVATEMQTGTLEQLRTSRAAIETGLSQLNSVWDAGLFTNEQRQKLLAQLDSLNAAIRARELQIAKDVEAAAARVRRAIITTPTAFADRPGSGEGRGGLGPVRPRAWGGPVTAGMPYVVGERRPELFIPTSSGRIVPQVPSGGMGGNTYNIAVEGLIRAADPFEIATQLRRLASFGVLTPRVAG